MTDDALPTTERSVSNAEVIAVVNELYRTERSLDGLRQRLRPRIAPFHRLLPLVPPDSTVLDIGCGAGLWSGLLAVAGQASFVHGVDTSGAAVEVARRMREHLPEPLRDRLFFERRDATAGLPESEFDVVSMVDVVHHLPPRHQRPAIAEAWRRVRPGGLFLYKDMASKPWYCAAMNRMHDLVMAREWIHYYPVSGVEGMALRDGGSVEDAGTARMWWWYRHEWRLFRKARG
jgi:SAM-dependent methyltransferase